MMKNSTTFQHDSPWYGEVMPSSVGRPINVRQDPWKLISFRNLNGSLGKFAFWYFHF